MFEGPKEDKELVLHKAWIGVFVAVAAIIALVGFYAANKNSTRVRAQNAPVADITKADAVKDLKIERASMQKDSLGTTAVWTVTLINRSDTFTYTEIAYEAQYIGADNQVILNTKGTIPATMGPNSEKTSEIRDVAYPSAVVWYRMKVTAAKAKIG